MCYREWRRSRRLLIDGSVIDQSLRKFTRWKCRPSRVKSKIRPRTSPSLRYQSDLLWLTYNQFLYRYHGRQEKMETQQGHSMSGWKCHSLFGLAILRSKARILYPTLASWDWYLGVYLGRGSFGVSGHQGGRTKDKLTRSSVDSLQIGISI
ncbi:hypothetical protein L218DRAFT_665087 [Marasmius fiardii PR-910]|nr:hypothetical protein L218DRAFT_665087 [Marasmius fiardii PR-910]